MFVDYMQITNATDNTVSYAFNNVTLRSKQGVMSSSNVKTKVSIEGYDYDEMSLHTLMNNPAQKEFCDCGDVREYGYVGLHKLSKYVSNNGNNGNNKCAVGINCSVDDNKLDIVLVAKNSNKVIKKSKKIYDEGKWYSNNDKVVYLKASEIRLTVDDKGVEIDGVKQFENVGGDVSVCVKNGMFFYSVDGVNPKMYNK